MITKLLLKPPHGSLRLIAPNGVEITADENGLFDITAHPNLAAQNPSWELRRVEE